MSRAGSPDCCIAGVPNIAPIPNSVCGTKKTFAKGDWAKAEDRLQRARNSIFLELRLVEGIRKYPKVRETMIALGHRTRS